MSRSKKDIAIILAMKKKKEKDSTKSIDGLDSLKLSKNKDSLIPKFPSIKSMMKLKVY